MPSSVQGRSAYAKDAIARLLSDDARQFEVTALFDGIVEIDAALLQKHIGKRRQ